MFETTRERLAIWIAPRTFKNFRAHYDVLNRRIDELAYEKQVLRDKLDRLLEQYEKEFPK